MDLFLPGSFHPGFVGGVIGRSEAEGRVLSFSAGAATSEGDAAASRRALARLLGVEVPSLVFARQVHGSRVARVGRPSSPGEADGMVTAEVGVVLCLSVADCCAILAVDPVRRCVGAFHAGWRGARDGIAAAGVDAMRVAFGTRPADLVVYLSPCASGERYEVGQEVAELFPSSTRAARTETGQRWYLDLRAELRLQLEALGVVPESIEASPLCTIADPRCHSHRRDGAASGRMAAFVGMIRGGSGQAIR